MLRHIVCCDVKADRQSDVDRLVAMLKALPDQISEIQSLTCGRSVSGTTDFGLVVDLEDRDALDRYRTHEAHHESLELLRAIALSIHVSDIEI